MKRILKYLLFFCCLLMFSVGVFFIKLHDFYEGSGPLKEERTVSIAKGASLISIAEQLERDGVIYNSLVFRFGAKLTKASTNLKAGIYDFPAHISSKEVLSYMVDGGRELNYRIVIPEGLTIAQIFHQLNIDDRLHGKLPPVGGVVPGTVIESGVLLETPADETSSKASEIFIMPDEGDLLPETYFFSDGDSKISIVNRMRHAMKDNLDELWLQRDENLIINNKRDALVMASLVERETYIIAEKPIVASVFLNRLKNKMRLQTDPTVIYALSDRWGRIERPLAVEDYKLDDPYNTYRIDGLPPGPICNPGIDAIHSVLHPAETEFLFFVADGTGGHKFASTFEEHKQNRKKWLKIIRKRRQALKAVRG